MSNPNNVTFQNIPLNITKTNDEVVILNTLHRLETIFPNTSKEVINFIINENIDDILKSIRQRSDEKMSMLFYDLLNGNFGFKIMKLLKQTNDFCA